MSYMPVQQRIHPASAPSILSVLGGLKARLAQRRSYRQTVTALAQLSDRELADLGLNRHSIHGDAWRAVYGADRRG